MMNYMIKIINFSYHYPIKMKKSKEQVDQAKRKKVKFKVNWILLMKRPKIGKDNLLNYWKIITDLLSNMRMLKELLQGLLTLSNK